MTTLAGAEQSSPRSLVVPAAVALGAVAVGVAAWAGTSLLPALAFAALALGAGLLVYRGGLQWKTLLHGIVALIIFIPIGRYVLPGSLPFELEPYRIVVAMAIALWISALLIDPRVRLGKSGLEPPLALLLAATLASVIANPDRVSTLGTDVAKSLTFFLSFLLFFFMFVSVVRDRRVLDGLIGLLVGGGAIVAALTVVESRTGYNVFDHLAQAVPILEPNASAAAPDRDGLNRAYGSAQHPIAMGAAFVMLIPLAIYLISMRKQRVVWGACCVLLVLGSLATISKTSVVMLAALALVYLWLRPRETKRLSPLLIPLLLVIHIALPGTMGSLKTSFFPSEGLVASQKTSAGTYSSGRIADVDPALEQFGEHPFLGKGYGTFIVEKDRANALILDDQWLGTLLEIGAIGAIAWAWLILRAVRRLGRRAREDWSPTGLLAAGLAASITTFAIGMFTFDSFAFIQVTFLLFILLAVSATTLRLRPDDEITSPDETTAREGSRAGAPVGGPGRA